MAACIGNLTYKHLFLFWKGAVFCHWCFHTDTWTRLKHSVLNPSCPKCVSALDYTDRSLSQWHVTNTDASCCQITTNEAVLITLWHANFIKPLHSGQELDVSLVLSGSDWISHDSSDPSHLDAHKQWVVPEACSRTSCWGRDVLPARLKLWCWTKCWYFHTIKTCGGNINAPLQCGSVAHSRDNRWAW